MNPQKAEQAERLGMGFGGFAAPSSGVSHSILSEMKTIEQERPSTGSSSSKSKFSKPGSGSKDFFAMDSDHEDDDGGFDDLGFGSGSWVTGSLLHSLQIRI